MERFKGKIVLVTGGNRNTGLDIVEKFVREGAKVYMCGSSAESTELDMAGRWRWTRHGFTRCST